MDPDELEEISETRKQSPWSGYWYVNIGANDNEDMHCRNWEDNVKYGYISAGQGPKYSKQLTKLKENDKIFAYRNGRGYVGYGIVLSPSIMIKNFEIEGIPLLNHELKAEDAGRNHDDPEMSEWVVKIKWIKTFPLDEAIYKQGIFANPNIVCKLKDQDTLNILKKSFEIDE